MTDIAVRMQAQVTHGVLDILCLRNAFQIFHHGAPPEPVTSHYIPSGNVGLIYSLPCQIPERNALSDGQMRHVVLPYNF